MHHPGPSEAAASAIAIGAPRMTRAAALEEMGESAAIFLGAAGEDTLAEGAADTGVGIPVAAGLVAASVPLWSQGAEKFSHSWDALFGSHDTPAVAGPTPDSPSLPRTPTASQPGAGMSVEQAEKPKDNTYSRPSLRKSTRDQIYENQRGDDGKVRKVPTGEEVEREGEWDAGHKPGYEFRKHQQSAQEREIPRSQFRDEHNNADHYQVEDRQHNRSHRGEDNSDSYLGP